jgi:hypothetical protein
MKRKINIVLKNLYKESVVETHFFNKPIRSNKDGIRLV